MTSQLAPPAGRNSLHLVRILAILVFCDLAIVSFAQDELQIPPPQKPVQFTEPQLVAQLVEASAFIRAPLARSTFMVDGSGLTVAVVDTGLRTTHVDFRDPVTGVSRVVAQRNFTADNAGDRDNATDGQGHGTNVAGIVAANRLHVGIAPGAQVIPLKVLPNVGGGDLNWTRDALRWVSENREQHHISVVNLSLGTATNYTSLPTTGGVIQEIAEEVQRLRSNRVAVVIAAGNDFFRYSGQQGMSFPGIIREGVSVGAVYDSNLPGNFSYGSGAVALQIKEGFLTPFTQRLHESTGGGFRTDIFAPGAPITSSGIENDNGESIQHGTSQASPVVSGVILLLQQYHKRVTGELPEVNQVEEWLRSGAFGTEDVDPDNTIDNVSNTGLRFLRLDALDTLRSAQQSITQSLLDPDSEPLRGRKI